MGSFELGSKTAKGGFDNEHFICDKFLNFKADIQAQEWLSIMGYDYNKIKILSAFQIPVRINESKAIELGITKCKYEESLKYKKADVQIRLQITIDDIEYVENLSLKKANRKAGFNQVDKRAVATYQKMWGFDDDILHFLQLFTGAISPTKTLRSSMDIQSIRDKGERRLFLDEIPLLAREKIINFFNANKVRIISDILKGRGGLSAEWFLVTQKDVRETLSWVLKDINFVCNFYAQGEVAITPRGSLKIGRVTMQRKGGTPDPTSLQFKINPLELFSA